MGECGCSHINYAGKITDANHNDWIIGIYLSCDYCQGPAGIRIIKVKPEDQHMYDTVHIPRLTKDVTTFDVIDGGILKKYIRKLIEGFKPDGTRIDQIEADVIADEIDLRDIVSKSKEKVEWNY